MPNTMSEPEPEPVIEAVEIYPNHIYKIVYTHIFIGFDDTVSEPVLMSNDCVRFYEITDHNTHGELWSNPSSLNEVNIHKGCCSQAFMEHINKEVEKNKTQFPTCIKFCSDESWLIYSIKKIN